MIWCLGSSSDKRGLEDFDSVSITILFQILYIEQQHRPIFRGNKPSPPKGLRLRIQESGAQSTFARSSEVTSPMLDLPICCIPSCSKRQNLTTAYCHSISKLLKATPLHSVSIFMWKTIGIPSTLQRNASSVNKLSLISFKAVETLALIERPTRNLPPPNAP